VAAAAAAVAAAASQPLIVKPISSKNPLEKESLFMSDRKEKQAQFAAQPKKKSFLPLALIALVLLLGGGLLAYKLIPGAAGCKFPEVVAEQGQIVLPLAQVGDGQAHFFSYRSGGTEVNFFVLKSQDGVLRAALDTCDVCYHARKGYRQEGAELVCNNCDMRFPAQLIGEVQGGCNPAPLKPHLAEGQVRIAEADLVAGAWYFQTPPK
jgi:uncharacterized membrane protein